MNRAALLALCGLLAASCAAEALRPDYERAHDVIRGTTGIDTVHDPEAPPLGPDEIREALADGLGMDEAVRLALLNSRRLQAGFMGLGTARADYVQSGLLENPTLGLSFLFPAGGSDRTRLAGTMAMGIAETWRLPERRRTAAGAMEQRLLELGQLAGRLVADTRAAYARTVAARELVATARDSATLSARALEAVENQVARGVASSLQLQAARADALSTELDARSARRAEAEAARHLAALLSLTEDLHEVPLVDPLPDPAPLVTDREAMVAHALATRLDLRALQAAVAAAEARVELERARAGPDVEAGIGYERPESDDPTDHVLGPVLAVELPIFDGNEAQISRAEYELEQMRRTWEAAEAEARQEVRAAADGARLAADGSRFLRDELLPQAERAAALVREAYENGNTTLLPLLDAERTLARARALRVESALEVVLATAELERALGGPLPAGDVGP